MPSLPQPMGRAGAGRANSHPVPASLGWKGGSACSGQACCCEGWEKDGDDLRKDGEVKSMMRLSVGVSGWGFSIFDPGKSIRQLPPMGEAGEE